MNLGTIKDSIENLWQCLAMIEDETEVRPGTTTIRGTDGGVIDGAVIRHAIDVARSDLRDIERELNPTGEEA